VTDANGGTDVVAMLPQHVHFVGADALACMSLRERGLLRWYASCCNTPIANTPRNRNVPYVGVARMCLDAGTPTVDESFGVPRIAVNVKSARGHVASTPLAAFVAVLRLGMSAIGGRLAGGVRDHPFFQPGASAPIRPVRVLSATERAHAYDEPGQR